VSSKDRPLARDGRSNCKIDYVTVTTCQEFIDFLDKRKLFLFVLCTPSFFHSVAVAYCRSFDRPARRLFLWRSLSGKTKQGSRGANRDHHVMKIPSFVVTDLLKNSITSPTSPGTPPSAAPANSGYPDTQPLAIPTLFLHRASSALVSCSLRLTINIFPFCHVTKSPWLRRPHQLSSSSSSATVALERQVKSNSGCHNFRLKELGPGRQTSDLTTQP
jgi:hypothetical protein